MTKIQHVELNGARFALVPEETFRKMSEALEDLEDIRLFEEAVAEMREHPDNWLSDDAVTRMLAGESLIRLWREQRALSIHALAEKAGISAAYLSEIENGKKEPSLKVLRNIAGALGLDIGDLA